MYSKGESVPLDYRKAVIWAERLMNFYTDSLGGEDEKTLGAINLLMTAYTYNGEYTKLLPLGYEAPFP